MDNRYDLPYFGWIIAPCLYKGIYVRKNQVRVRLENSLTGGKLAKSRPFLAEFSEKARFQDRY